MAQSELHTERLLLRPFRADDVAAAQEYRNDQEFASFLPHIPQPFTKQHAQEFVALNMSEPWERSPTFAVVLKGKLIGTVNFEIDARHADSDARVCDRMCVVGSGNRYGSGACGKLSGLSRRSVSWDLGIHRMSDTFGQFACSRSWGRSMRPFASIDLTR